jgi:3'-phosphoadenosine 5'-phosphosulfate (PAPS) 3'-phosphatase
MCFCFLKKKTKKKVADLASQKLIISGLWSVYPGLAVVGEEDTPNLSAAEEKPRLDLVDLEAVPRELRAVPLDDVCVYIDPLDATKEYTLGKTWCVMTLIGITLRGLPIAGVMHQPFGDGERGRTVYGMQGFGVIGLQRKVYFVRLLVCFSVVGSPMH